MTFLESTQYIRELLADPNLFQIEIWMSEEDDEFSCKILCEDQDIVDDEWSTDLEQGQYGYVADCISLSNVPLDLIIEICKAKEKIEVQAQKAAMKRINDQLKKEQQ